MPQRTDAFDLARLRLSAGEGRRLDLHVDVDPFELAGQRYEVRPAPLPVRLELSRMRAGWALRLRFDARLVGPCMRCLTDAAPVFSADAREVSQPGGGEELTSPYVDEAEVVDLKAWTRDALALALPSAILCRPECAGLCPVCGADLNEAGPDHHHEAAPDPRWAKLRELKLD